MLGRRAFLLSVVLVVHAAAVLLLQFSLPRTTSPAQSPAMQVSLIERRESRPAPPTQTASPSLIAPVPRSIAVPTPLMYIELPANPPETPQPAAAPTVESPKALPTVNSGVDLSVLCPGRTPPAYPEVSRELREQGEVTLRVELDAHGDIDSVVVTSSSGSRRLDEAAREAVLSWHCRPAERDGRSVRAIALQTLAFVLQRR